MQPKFYAHKTTVLGISLCLFFQFTLYSQSAIDTLIFEQFSTGILPVGWSNIDNGSTSEIWEFNNPGGQTIGGNFDSDFAILDSDNYGFSGNQNASLITPTFDLSSYTSNIKIFVKYDYEYDSNFNATSAKVEFFNGTSWVEIKSYTNLNLVNSTELIEISTIAAGASNAQVRMTFIGDDGYWWAIDNFEIFAQLLDADQDGISDSEDADSDNDGIPNSVEGSCSSYTLIFQDYWSALEDPVLDAPSSPLDFGLTSVSLDRRDPQNIVAYGSGGGDPDSTGIASQNGITSYKVIQSSTTSDSSEHIFKFSKPVANLVFGIVDVDQGSNFIDHTIVNGYAGDTIYNIKITDTNSGPYANFNEGENSFTGHTETTNSDALSQVSFPVLIDSVVVIYSNKQISPTAHQAIIFNASFAFCDTEDSDGDRIPDYLDLDSDDDGIPDLIEIGGVDLDGDGRVDNNTDSDGDGLATTFDTDDNDKNSFISNLLTGGINAKNSDTDMIPDYLDLDADNDGIPDIVEAGGIDFDGDGMVDDLDANGQLTTDADNDGFTDWYDPDNDGTLGVDSGSDEEPLVVTNASAAHFHGETGDSHDIDGDNLPNHLDLDADNDGIPDLVEAGGIDVNGDGRVDIVTDFDEDGYADIYDTNDDKIDGVEDATDALLQTAGTDTDADKKSDDLAITWNNGQGNNKDTDGDGFIDGLDLDADDDGIPDNIEAGTNDPQADGKVNTGLAPWDADGDGLANVYDENANDGPSSAGGNPNGLALVETTVDTNNDGIVNNTEAMASGGGGYNNTNLDQDKNPNHLDLDSDNDGITDVVENAGGAVSADHSSGVLDGIVGDNSTVTDVDKNGWHDPSTSATLDSDNDNLPDFLDKDADNDGIVDYLEGVCSTCPTFTDLTVVDANGNGVLDKYEVLNSNNENGGSNIGTTPNLDDDDLVDTTPDYLDTDTDQDGQYDWTEGYDANDNGVANDDIISMALAYENANSNPGEYTTADADSDNIPDWLDNQPGVAGYNPNIRPPFLVEGSGYWVDADKDGLAAIFDLDENGTAAPTPDNNGGNDNDWRDETALVALPVELIAFSVEIVDCSILINWATASEKDFSHFELERSNNGTDFERITSVESLGGDQLNTYQFLDKNTLQSENYYYRLKMVDLDLSFVYSDVKNLTSSCHGVEFEINVYPNPIGLTTDELTLELRANKQNHYIFITDSFGKIWYENEVDQFQQILTIDTNHLPNGSYNILIENDGSFAAKRFVKTK
ncbi:MAG: T9SS type A sorting domain-containing protein [Saprospiraceae bacterium]